MKIVGSEWAEQYPDHFRGVPSEPTPCPCGDLTGNCHPNPAEPKVRPIVPASVDDSLVVIKEEVWVEVTPRNSRRSTRMLKWPRGSVVPRREVEEHDRAVAHQEQQNLAPRLEHK